MNSFESTIILAVVLFLLFLSGQIMFFMETRKYRNLFANFFRRASEYETYLKEIGEEQIPQLKQVGTEDSDLNKLIVEMNH